MATTANRVQEICNLMQDVDLPGLLTVDQELHRLLEERGQDQLRRGKTTAREELRQRYPHLALDAELFDLVGIHPESPLHEDKSLIHEQVTRKLMR